MGNGYTDFVVPTVALLLHEVILQEYAETTPSQTVETYRDQLYFSPTVAKTLSTTMPGFQRPTVLDRLLKILTTGRVSQLGIDESITPTLADSLFYENVSTNQIFYIHISYTIELLLRLQTDFQNSNQQTVV